MDKKETDKTRQALDDQIRIAKSQAQLAGDKATAKFHEMTNDWDETAKHVKNVVKEKATEASNRVEETVQKVKHRIDETFGSDDEQ